MDVNRKLKAIETTSAACSNMINEVRQLRLSVVDLFSTLADNGPDPQRSQQIDQENLFINGNKLHQQQNLSKLATSHSLCTSSIPPPRIQKQQEQQQQIQLLQYVNQMISSIAASMRSLDQNIVLLVQNQSLMNPGESIHLAMDCSLDKHNLYMDLCKSYETFTKLHEYAQHCGSLLNQQSLKRNHKRPESTNNSQSSHPIVATFNPYSYKIPASPKNATVSSLLDTIIHSMTHTFMTGVYAQPFGISTGVYQISMNRVLKAILLMRGVVVDAVIVKAYHESFASKATAKGSSASLLAEQGSSPFVNPDEDDIDLWTESKYAVFRKLTHNANAAVLHFQYPTLPQLALRTFLSWFNSHSDLFSATCSRCNSRLRKFMPPICREYSAGFNSYHDSCK